ncbi:TonB-dependent receptor [Larkinella rosea]|uniref:TonB-dependent receptor n=1 Tax=Larkinella rosea TaxID=2025312 RepID=A0A3P1BJH0_9BACT|nr:TonB-dependent receptor [Larkinella rosea]
MYLSVLLMLGSTLFANAQSTATLIGKVISKQKPLELSTVALKGTRFGTLSDSAGVFKLTGIPAGRYQFVVSQVGFDTYQRTVTLTAGQTLTQNVDLKEAANTLGEVVITGTMKEVSKLESPVPVEIYTPKFFQKNPTPNIYDALQNINGVRPQLNCNVCNTGDIHINGLEGPYTMVLLDGMPIVSSLSTVYGLSGIPNSLVERVEVVKGPASTLYGSEAVAGLINIITKNPLKAPTVTADVFGTSWQEYNADLGVKFRAGNANSLVGINYYNFQHPYDKNGDGFTDVTLQHRISLFNKWQFQRKENRQASIAGRYFYEDRWGGQTNWTPQFRGTDSLYAESIYTKRIELIGSYQLPTTENITLQSSFNSHHQNSYYGTTAFIATQRIFFAQLLWNKEFNRHFSLLVGTPFRYTFYDDSTPATRSNDAVPVNQPDRTVLPGVFAQPEFTFNPKHKLLLGLRYDYNSRHGNILTPRFSYKWAPNKDNVVRLNAGTGYRVVNLFTEDHAALTGARQVIVKDELKPERSWNVNVNYTKQIIYGGGFLNVDASVFYTYFTNRIIADYDTDPNKIFFDNLKGHSTSKGVSVNLEASFTFPLKINTGFTLMDVYKVETGADGQDVRTRQLLTERITGTWTASYEFGRGFSADYTGNLYGPMRLPRLSSDDPRAPYSPTWSIQNIQVTKKFDNGFEIYGGIKNLLNFTPPANSIARANDPFDKRVSFDQQGQVVATPDNPYRLTFDPNYVFAPNQGIRGFLGVRYTVR